MKKLLAIGFGLIVFLSILAFYNMGKECNALPIEKISEQIDIVGEFDEKADHTYINSDNTSSEDSGNQRLPKESVSEDEDFEETIEEHEFISR